MSVKEEKSSRTSGNKNNTGIKILNDENIPALPKPLMMSTPLASHVSTMTIANSNSKPSTKQKKMDHYVMQTVKNESVKGESSAVTNEDEDTIDFILADDEDEINSGLGKPSGEITEEFHISGDENAEGENAVKEIVEHVCGKCYKTFRRMKSLKKHLEFCRFDSSYHLRKAEMLKNLKKIEKDAIVMENKDICFCCSESYDTFHLGHINCPDCPKSFKTQMSYERHIFITHSELDDFPCSICNAKLRSDGLLKLHEEQHRNRGKPFACKICGKDFTRSYHLKRHQKYSSCSANENDTMSCKVCDKVFYRLDNLRSHLKQHLGTQVVKKPEYMCSVCKNCFYSLSTLNIHIRTHTGERPFDCDLCDKKFSALVALKKHRRYHTGEKPYTCTVCGQSFAVKEVLNRHMKRHTGERPHKCNECGKSFIQATQLRTHAKTHTKPHECYACEEKFKTEKQLDRHMKTHNRSKFAKQFKCSICKKSFREQSKLDDHMEKGEHKISKTRSKRKERTDCAICDKNFDSAKTLKFHILKVHEVDPEELFGDKPITKVESSDATSSPAKRLKRSITENVTSTTTSQLLSSNADANGLVVREFLIDEVPTSNNNGAIDQQTITLENETYTVIRFDNLDGIDLKPTALEASVSPTMKKEQRQSLAASLAAAIADNPDEMIVEEFESEEDLKLKDNVYKLLDMLVDKTTLKKFGWPQTTEEVVLCKVIENCGHELSKDGENYMELDYATRMREYVKLLFTVVIHNDSIKELLNNYPIDDVIEYVLGNDDDDDDNQNDEFIMP